APGPVGADGWSVAAPPPPAPAWGPPPSAPPPPAKGPTPAAVRATDDFFSSPSPSSPKGPASAKATTGVTVSRMGRLAQELKALGVKLPDELVASHVVAREGISGRDTHGAFVRLEVLGLSHAD